MPIPPIEVGTLAEALADRIGRAIVDGELTLGERLGEQRWAETFGVSRGPVREAALLLVARGLLVQHPRRGFFVRSFSVKEIDDLYDLRAAIERQAIKQVTEMGECASLTKSLATQIEAMGVCAASDDLRALAEADLAFHRIVVAHANSGRLLSAFEDLSAELLLLIPRLDVLRLGQQELVDNHRPLLDALSRADRCAAERALDDHLDEARESMRRYFSDRDDICA